VEVYCLALALGFVQNVFDNPAGRASISEMFPAQRPAQRFAALKSVAMKHCPGRLLGAAWAA